MTIYEICEKKLEQFPAFRERRFRGKFLAKLTLRDLGLLERYEETGTLDYEDLVSFASKYDSYRHEYDRVLKDRKDLRGTDYPDGEALAQAKCLEFGYTPGYHQTNKLLEKITNA